MCYNEVNTLESVVSDVKRVLESIASEYEIIIVDDGSNDGSLEKASKLVESDGRIRLISHGRNLGIGMVLRNGYLHARYENVVAIPADGQFDVRELEKLKSIPPKTVVSFYRTNTPYKSFFRNFLSWLNNKLINRMILGMDVKDVNWVKVYKTSELRKLNLRLKSVLISSEICAKLSILGCTFVEYPSKYLRRKHGVEKGTSLRNVIMSAIEILKLILVVMYFRLYERRGITC